MTEKDLEKLGFRFDLDLDGEGRLEESSEFDYEEIEDVISPFSGAIFDVLNDCKTLEEHEAECRILADLEDKSGSTKHPYLNAPSGPIRNYIKETAEISKENRVSRSSIYIIRDAVNKNLDKSKENQTPLHSKIYMMASYLLYSRYEIVTDDDISRSIITALYESDEEALSTFRKHPIHRIYVKVFQDLTDDIRIGLDYSGFEKTNLIKKHKKIAEMLEMDVDSGNLFKCIYVINERLNALDDTLNYFDVTNVFADFTGRSLNPTEARFVIDLLFDKPKANKFEFLSEISEYSDLLEENPKNIALLSRAIEGLGNNLSHSDDMSVSASVGYNRLVSYLDSGISILTGDFKEDMALASSGELLERIKDFIAENTELESYQDWNDLSVISFILRHMRAQQELPDYYENEDDLSMIHNELKTRLTSGRGVNVVKCPTDNGASIYGAMVEYFDKSLPLVLNIGKPKSLLSAVEKKLRGSTNIDDTFRVRIGIPYELDLRGDTLDISNFCYAATDLLLNKLGAHPSNIRNVKASLLTDDPHLNQFSKSIRTFKYIVDVLINGRTVPIEVMMILFYPDDHSSYKEKQCQSTRNKLGLLPVKDEIKKAIEYLDWKYALNDDISETDVRRLNSIIKTIVNENNSEILEDQKICDKVYQLAVKFKDHFTDRQYLSAIIRKVIEFRSKNERRRLIEEIRSLRDTYTERANFKNEDIELIKSITLDISNYGILDPLKISELQTVIAMLEIEGCIELPSLRENLFDLLDLAVGGKESQSQ